MTKRDFFALIKRLEVAIGVQIDGSRLDEYAKALGDLPVETLSVAIDRIILKWRYPSFPRIADLRAEAADIGKPELLPSAEAWKLAWRAIGKIDPDIDGSVDRQTKDLPDVVKETMQQLGIRMLCYSKSPVAVLQAQFTKAYEANVKREQQRRQMPDKLKNIPGTNKQVGKASKAIKAIADATKPKED